MSIKPREPESCSEGYTTYQVLPGVTMYEIAISYGIELQELIEANPHIPNPNVIYPGDILCVPKEARPVEEIDLPCFVLLKPAENRFSNTGGLVYVRRIGEEYGISIFAFNLPPAEELDNYNAYEGNIILPKEQGAFGLLLSEITEVDSELSILTGSINFRFPLGLTGDTKIRVRATNTGVPVTELTVLTATLEEC